MKQSKESGWGSGQEALDPVTVFVISWGRPLYLWACLDSLYRMTRPPARFVLLDNAHPDPLVSEVIAGFVRRGMFDEVVRFDTNSWENISHAYGERLPAAGPLHVTIESDCVIVDSPGCWLNCMRRIMEEHASIGVLGSLIDPADFVSPEEAVRVTDGDSSAASFLAKLESPERGFLVDRQWQAMDGDFFITEPPCPIGNVPGRLMMLRTDVMRKIGLLTDAQLSASVRRLGLQPAVTTLVRHRHLSLLNVFDYPDYDKRGRDAYFFPPK